MLDNKKELSEIRISIQTKFEDHFYDFRFIKQNKDPLERDRESEIKLHEIYVDIGVDKIIIET